MHHGTINSFQFLLLIINYLIGSAIVFSPTIVITEAKQDGWISFIVATIIGFLIIYVNAKLFKHYPRQGITKICENILSKPIGRIFGFAYTWFFLFLTAILLREIGSMITVTILPGTPFIAINIIFSILIFYAAYQGIQVIGRSNEIFSILAFIGFWITIFLVIPLMEFDRILPILDEGFSPVSKGAFLLLGFTYSEIITLFMILPYVETKKGTTKIFMVGSAIASFTLTITTLTLIFVLGIQEVVLTNQSPIILARFINIGDFLTRVETLILISYIITVFVKLLVTFFATLVSASQVFTIKDYRNIILPLSLIILSLSVLFIEGATEFGEFVSTTWTPYALLFGLVIPLILLCISYIKNRLKN